MASLLPSDVTRLIDKLFTWVSADRQVWLSPQSPPGLEGRERAQYRWIVAECSDAR